MNGAGQDALAGDVIDQAQVALDAAAKVRQRLVQAGILDQDEPPLTRGQMADQSIGTPSHVVIVEGQSPERARVSFRRSRDLRRPGWR